MLVWAEISTRVFQEKEYLKNKVCMIANEILIYL